MRLRLYLAQHDFSLMTGSETGAYQVKVEDCAIRLHAIEPNPALLLAHDERLSKQNAKFTYTKSDMHS